MPRHSSKAKHSQYTVRHTRRRSARVCPARARREPQLFSTKQIRVGGFVPPPTGSDASEHVCTDMSVWRLLTTHPRADRSVSISHRFHRMRKRISVWGY